MYFTRQGLNFTRKSLLAFFTLLCILNFSTKEILASEPNDPEEFETFLDEYLAEKMEEFHISGAVFTLVKDGEVFFSKGYGYSNLETKKVFDPKETVLMNASLAKIFTAISVLQLYEDGQIDLREDIRPYIDGFTLPDNYPGTLSFANLLTHTDGFEARMIGDAAFDIADLKPLEELLDRYMPTQLYAPGEFMTYSNFAANIAGTTVSKISGQLFEEYAAENILLPLNMTSSSLTQPLPDALEKRMATGYSYGNDELTSMPRMYIRYAPAGGLSSTADDISKLMIALLNNGEYDGQEILEEDTVNLMFTQQYTPDPRMGGMSYGLFEHKANGETSYLRDGDGVGTKSRIFLMPEHDLGFFINYNEESSQLRLEIVDEFLNRYFPKDTEENATPISDHKERVSRFEGTYQPIQADLSSFAKIQYFFAGQIEIRSDDSGYLFIKAAGRGDGLGGFEEESKWLETDELYFQRVDGNGQVAFLENEDGEISHIVSGQGYHATYEKLAWYETQSFHIIFIEIIVLIIASFQISTLLIWPILLLIRKFRHKTALLGNNDTFAIAARIYAALVSGMLALLVFRSIGVLFAIDSIAGLPNYVFGVRDTMKVALNINYVPAILSIVIPVLAVFAWKHSWWTRSTRIHFSFLTFAVLGAIWWIWYWNLLGFRL
jgi:CubicO group peptidase (beta-lactamase class C family)